MIFLNRNECPFPPSASVWQTVKEYITSLNRYEVPELTTSLINKLSNYVGVGSKFIHLVPGSEAFFIYLREHMLLKGLSFVYSTPTFMPAQEDMQAVGVKTYDIPLTKVFKLDYHRLKSFGDRSKVLYIINPNNPSGNQVVECAFIPELLERYNLVILDEAYYEFSRLTCKQLIMKHHNLIILRTLSKAFCLAGARVGYFIAEPEAAQKTVETARKYDISTLSLSAALGALNDVSYMRDAVGKVEEIRDYVISELSKYPGLEAVNTLCNFILLRRKGYSSVKLSNEFLKHGVRVKPLRGRLKEFTRVSIGTEEEMEEFLRAVRKLP